MKFMALKVESLHLGVADFDSGRVFFCVQRARHLQPFAVGRGGYQIDHHFVAAQWLAPPVLAYEREEAMLYFVPFAGARRQMTDLDGHSRFAGQLLEFHLPQTHARAVAAAAVGSIGRR
jgi:hypothetical protein